MKEFTLEQQLMMATASLEYLSNGKDEIFELLQKIREQFDDTEYMQGKKDGLRTALALLGMPEMLQFNRGGGMGREAEYRGTGAVNPSQSEVSRLAAENAQLREALKKYENMQ
jgi:hypothetical protein